MNIHTPVSALEYIMAAHGRPNYTQYSMIPLIENTANRCSAFLVSRQGGSTDAIIASAIHDALSNDSKVIAISAHDWQSYSEKIVDMMTAMYGDMVQGMITVQRKSEIRFANNSRILIKARNLHATTYRGWTIFRLYLDCNIYDTDWSYFMQSIMPTLASSTGGKLFAVFTASSIGDETHKFWESFLPETRHVLVRPLDVTKALELRVALGNDFFEREYLCKFI